MKKILCGILAAAMAVSCVACSSGKDYSEYGDKAVLEVENVTAKAGDKVELDVYLNNNPGTSTVGVELEFDENVLTPVSIEASGKLKGQGFFTTNLAADEYGVFTGDDGTYVKGLWFNVSDWTDNGEVMTVTFEVAEDAAAGEYPITFIENEDDLVNQDFENVETVYLDGSVTIS